MTDDQLPPAVLVSPPPTDENCHAARLCAPPAIDALRSLALLSWPPLIVLAAGAVSKLQSLAWELAPVPVVSEQPPRIAPSTSVAALSAPPLTEASLPLAALFWPPPIALANGGKLAVQSDPPMGILGPPVLFSQPPRIEPATSVAALPVPPLTEEPTPEAVLLSPPLTDAKLREAVLNSPPVTLAPLPPALLNWPPVTVAYFPDAALNYPSTVE